MRKSVAQSVTGVLDDLHEAGMVDDRTVREIHALCLPEGKGRSPSGPAALRKKMRLEERGVNRPTGAAAGRSRQMPTAGRPKRKPT